MKRYERWGNFLKIFSTLLMIVSMTVFFSSCSLYQRYAYTQSQDRIWEELKGSVDDQVAAKDADGARDDVDRIKSQIIMSDIERGASDHIIKLFSSHVVSEIGEKELRSAIENMKNVFQGELVSYKTWPAGSSGHRGGKGVTAQGYKVAVYTDMDIYEMYLYYITEDSSSDDWQKTRANIGLHRIVILPVSVSYDKDGPEGSKYEDYLDKDGVFYIEADPPARSVTYEGKGYTGYSIVYLQEEFYEAADPGSCERLMEILDSVGFKGDITAVSYTDTDDASVRDYNMILTDEDGKDFYICKPQRENNQCVQGLKIADEQMKVLYE
ncbi:MAG TPA: DUF5104 domain-containing protein [Candidatus Scybalocola faecavium]|nr:DUF5104 domain-containing protein [Candidatus Scybalocola faecavium]